MTQVPNTVREGSGPSPVAVLSRGNWAKKVCHGGLVIATTGNDSLKAARLLAQHLFKKGVATILHEDVVAAILIVSQLQRDGLTTGDTARDVVSGINSKKIDDIFANKLTIELDRGLVKYRYHNGKQWLDITSQVKHIIPFIPSDANNPLAPFYRNQQISTKIHTFLRGLAGNNRDKSFAIFTGQPSTFRGRVNAIVTLAAMDHLPKRKDGEDDHHYCVRVQAILSKYLQKSVGLVDTDSQYNTNQVRHLIRSILRMKRIPEIRERIEDAIKSQYLGVRTAPNLEDPQQWPRHPIMRHIKGIIRPMVHGYIKQQDIQVDPQDLEHQVLFALTTYPPDSLYLNTGGYIHDTLKKMGAYDDWVQITRFDASQLDQYSPNTELIQRAIKGQYSLVRQRMLTSGIDMASILDLQITADDGTEIPFFGREGGEGDRWKIINKSGMLYAETAHNERVVRVPVRFHECAQAVAKEVTSKLHYIHTERNGGRSYALSVELPSTSYHNYSNPFSVRDGDTLLVPFAIQTVEFGEQSRDYKRLAALAAGMHPDRFVEVTRLYTFHGSPRNIVATMDAKVLAHLTNTKPNFSGLTTSFMPTYSETRSTTIAGPMKRCLLAKPLVHQFREVEVGDQFVLEHVTTRKMLEGVRQALFSTHPYFPLLPTIEVYCPADRSMGFAPLITTNQMVDYTLGVVSTDRATRLMGPNNSKSPGK